MKKTLVQLSTVLIFASIVLLGAIARPQAALADAVAASERKNVVKIVASKPGSYKGVSVKTARFEEPTSVISEPVNGEVCIYRVFEGEKADKVFCHHPDAKVEYTYAARR